MLGLVGQRVGDPPRSFVHLLGNEFADLRNVVAQIEMDAVDGVADLPGLPDQAIALGAQILQQRADAHLVLAVGVFESGNLAPHHCLEFGGARERALDAVTHGRHFAPDCLPDGDDRLARNRLRLGEPRREKICPSAWCPSGSGAEETPGHCSSSAALTGGAGGLVACASAAASRADSASWIAESAASVGSLIFFGVFAMCVVASYYAGL